MTAYERLVDALCDAGKQVADRGGDRTMAQCPAHDDGLPSLSVTRIDGSVLLHCHAGCQTDDVLGALKLEMRDLYDDRQGARYDYPDGRTVLRTPDKRFTQRGNTKGRSLFHVDKIASAATVYVVEGEKDVLAVEAAGAAAVCPAMGAGKARQFDWSSLTDKHVVIVADRDEPGRKHAAAVAELLDGKAASVQIVEAAVGKDAADHLAAGKTLDTLVPIINGVEGMPRLWHATDLKGAAQQRWLAKGRLLRAAINLLIGDEGIGKSLLWVWVVSAITTGKALPQFGIPARDPAHVILVVTEDDWQDTVRPRLDVAGADLTMVQVICIAEDGSGAPVFPRDLFLILEADPQPALIAVDAWLDTVPPALSVRDPQQARQALHPWKEIATKTDAAVLLLCHTNRVASPNARDRYGATGELRKKARMTLYAQSDDEGRLVVGPEKMNTAAPIPASTFSIEAVQHFPPTADDDGTVPRLVYAGDSDRTAREHIAATFEADHGEDRQDRTDAVRWLKEYIELHGPDVLSADAKREGAKAGFSERTLQRARQELKVVYGWVGNPPKTSWSLTANEPEPDGRDDEDTRSAGETDPVSHGTAGTAGTAAGQDARPRYASGTPLAQRSDQQKSPAVPAVPRENGAPNHGRFSPDPPCFHCDRPVVGKQTDEHGRPAHLSCQGAAEVKP